MAYQFVLPDIGEGVVEAEVLKWFVREGDAVVEDQPLVEVMTDKATVTIPSPKRGRVTRLLWKEGDVAKVHHALLEMEVEGEGVAATGATEAQSLAQEARAAVTAALPGGDGDDDAPAQERRKVLATPAVRALAREIGVELASVRGTGPGGRVTKADLGVHARNGKAGAPGAASSGSVEIVPVRGLRRRIAEKMARSKRTAAHFTFVEEADVSELVRAKERMARAASEEGVKLTFLPFVVKAAVFALRRFPYLNASFDEEKGEIHLKRFYDVGIATATEDGLSVPVLRRASERSILEVAREIERLAADARAGKLRPEDVGGSTFTVTSLGALGGLFATPVINYPEVAILGVHRIRPTPVVRDGQVVVRDVMHVSLTSDHRVVDGDQAAAFVYDVIRHLEDPSLLLLRMA
ncbi:MAG TPA: dihydrolipoamide acetyltransferase family protein [Anaeromyxobacteraceae bacterium]|nr:dihydrolipoamide acetyltransferase family protein [Anaeromyxobacteraceae bacterium]